MIVGKEGSVDTIEYTEELNGLQSQIKYKKCSNMK